MDNQQLNNFQGKLHIGFCELLDSEINTYNLTNLSGISGCQFTMSFQTAPYTSGCYFQENGEWESKGCTVSCFIDGLKKWKLMTAWIIESYLFILF